MKLKLILEEDNDKYPIASIDRCTLATVKPIKVGANGDFQPIILKDGQSKLTVYLYNEEHFLKASDEGKQIAFQSGPPVGGKPTGLVVRVSEGKVRVNVSDKAILKMNGESEAEPVNQAEEAKPKAQLTEDAEEVAGDYNLPIEFVEGPLDDYIREVFKRKAHIHEVIKTLNQEMGHPFNADKDLREIGTGILMDIIHNKNVENILPKVKQSTKKRFDPLDKPHNPAKVDKHPVDKEDKKEDGEAMYEMMERFCKNNIKTIKAFQFQTKEKNTLDKVFSETDLRIKAVSWYLVRRAKGGEPDNAMYEAIGEIFKELPSHLRFFAVYESIYFNQVDLGNIEHDPNDLDIEQVHTDYMSALLERFSEGIKPTELWKVYKPYYETKIADRVVK